MGITVREALEITALKNAKVVGGHKGLGNDITFVNIMEVPEVVKWMKGGELLVTAGFSLKDDADLRRNLIYDLAKKGVAAFGIKPGQYFEKVPEDMIEHADAVGLPLIELPKELPYMDFMIPIFEVLINNQLSLLKKTEEIHNKLLEIVLTGNGLNSVCQALANLVGNPVFIVDHVTNLLSSSWNAVVCSLPGKGEQEILGILQNCQKVLDELNPHRCHRLSLPAEEGTKELVIVPIEINGSLTGYLGVLESYRVLDEQDLMALENASTIVALEFAKEKAVFEAERQVRGELLEDLIGGNFRYEEVIIRRASYLNFNLNARLSVFIVDIDYDHFENYFGGEGKRGESHVQEIKSRIMQIVHASFLDYPGGAMLLGKSDSITGLVRLSTKDEAEILRKKIDEIISNLTLKSPKVQISVGVGRAFSGARSVRQSYEEALAALRIGRFINGSANVTWFEDLGPYRFLYELKDSMAMQGFYHETLGKIITYDRQNNTELLKTLVHYFKNDCNLRLTSESLYIHKNSVIYRVKKIEEITGLSMNDPDERFNLQLSLKLSQIVSDFSTNSLGVN